MSDQQQTEVRPSNLGRLCDASDGANNFVQLGEYHRSAIDSHQQEQFQDDRPQTKLARLLLKLVNDTFLALPIERCNSIISNQQQEREEDQENSDACLIDWSGAKVLKNLGSINERDLEIAPSLPVDFLLPVLKNNKNFTTTTIARQNFNISNLSIFANNNSMINNNNNSNKHYQLDFNVVKLTYLSLSSLLSILGILINLFIILIIIFNTKQKRRSVLRSNNTSQNNLLLIQLTFTGILLASHVLLENFNIYNHQFERFDSKLSLPNQYAPMMMEDLRSQQSPLFNFLPPIPVQWQQWQRHVSTLSSCVARNYNNNNHYQQENSAFVSCVGEDDDDDDDDETTSSSGFKFHNDSTIDPEPNQINFVLILDFVPNLSQQQKQSSNDNRTNQRENDRLLGAPRGPWTLEYHVNHRQQYHQHEGLAPRTERRLIDLAGSLRSISVAELSCYPSVVRDGDGSDRGDGGGEGERVTKEEEGNGSDFHVEQEEHEKLETTLLEDNVEATESNSWQQNSEAEYSSHSSPEAHENVLIVNTTTTSLSQSQLFGLNELWLLLMKLLPIFMNVIASIHIWTVAALAYDRYCAIAHPLQYLRSIHTSRVRKFFIASWTISLLLNFLWPLSLDQIISHEWGFRQPASRNLSLAAGGRATWAELSGSGNQFANAPNVVNLNNRGSKDGAGCRLTAIVGASGGCCSCSTILGGGSVAMMRPKINFLSELDAAENIYQCQRSSLARLVANVGGHKFGGNNTKVGQGNNEMTRKLLDIQMRNSLIRELTAVLIEHHQQHYRQPSWSSMVRSKNLTRSSTNDTVDSFGGGPTTATTTTGDKLSVEDNDLMEAVTGDLYIVLLVVYSLIGYLIIILAPLLVITICNIMIYRIVKIHERRLSVNSGSNINTSASNLNYTGHNYQIYNHHHSHYSPHQAKLLRDSTTINNNNRKDPSDDAKSETSSIRSLLVNQLIKVGFLTKSGPESRNHLQSDPEAAVRHNCSDQDINQSCCPTSSIINNNKGDRNSSFDSPEDNKAEQQQEQQTTNESSYGGQQTTIVNRSKRVIIRQDSYQMLAKLKGGHANDSGLGASNPNLSQTPAANAASSGTYDCRPTSGCFRDSGGFLGLACKQVSLSGNCQAGTLSLAHHGGGSRPIKRKTSDHHVTRDFTSHRKDSYASQLSDYYRSDHHNGAGDNFSLNDPSPSANQNCDGKMFYEPSSSAGGGGGGRGIINQLKLAGLSFAGIAIQGSPSSSSMAFSGFNFGKPTLQKSSSCSLGNLDSSLNHPTQQPVNNMCQNYNHHTSSLSRCSMETSSSVHTCPKGGKSYISLNTTYKQQQHDIGNNTNKYLARLLDDGDSDSPQPYQSSGPHHYSHNSSRLSFTLGTKSPAFNVVVWLILSLLILTLPHYLIVTINQISELNPSFPTTNSKLFAANKQQVKESATAFELEQRYQEFLGTMVESILVKGATKMPDNDDKVETYAGHDKLDNLHTDGATTSTTDGPTIWETSSIWLSCLSRILFLSVVPLNGWLYGIRSRSLRAALKIVLKRYISRRQASIEINQRQRSISSMRSRDSSFMNLHHLLYYNHNSSTSASCNTNYRMPNDSPVRVFRRCSSFSGTKRDNNDINSSSSSRPFVNMDASGDRNLTTAPVQPEEVRLVDNDCVPLDRAQVQAAIKSTSAAAATTTSNCNTIRFQIGDSSSEIDSDNMTSYKQASVNLSQYCSQNTSPALSLAGSHRSLMSASIHSANSMLFDDKRSQDNSSIDYTNHHNHHHHQVSQPYKSLIKRSVARGDGGNSPTTAYDNLGRETFESDRRLKDIVIASHDKMGCSNFGRKNNLNSLVVDSVQFTNQVEAKTKTEVQRSASSTEPQLPKRKQPNDQFSNLKCHSNETPNEIRFFLTPADQRQHVIELGHGVDDNVTSMPKTKDIMTSLDDTTHSRTETKLAVGENVVDNDDGEQQVVSHCWWQELKVNLSKIINNASTKLLESDESNRRAIGKSNHGINSRGRRSQWLVESPWDQCTSSSRALLRKSSIDGQSLNWHQHLLADRLGLVSSSANDTSKLGRRTKNNSNQKKRFRASVTLDNIDSIERDEFRTNGQRSSHRNHHHKNNTSCQDCNGSTKTLDQSSAYLKPPNFLKLIFDHSKPYSGTSALSPIKEYSSNHSYASSQSSLNNTQHPPLDRTHLAKTSSMGEMDPTTTSTNIP